jgi:large subunit ribosomal protein L15
MSMELSKLSPPRGSRRKRKRVARGEGSGHGKTAGRGGKGQKGRKGVSIRAGFEGGQMPLYRRLPKFGFTSLQSIRGTNDFSVFNLTQLERFESGATVDPTALLGKGRGYLAKARVKILGGAGEGKFNKKLTVKVHAISESAKSAIEAAGGTVELIAPKAAEKKAAEAKKGKAAPAK